MSTTDRYVEVLTGFVGIVEDPPGSNQTPIGERFGWNGVAWCCETQSVTLEEVFGLRILWTASVAAAIDAARRGDRGLVLLDGGDEIRVGDLVTYDYTGAGDPSHFHIEGCVNPGVQSSFETVGGNVRDACRRQWRTRANVTHLIRPPYDTAASTGLAAPPEEDMGTLTDPDQIAALGRIDAGVAYMQTQLEVLDRRVTALEGLDPQVREVRRNLRAAGTALGFVAEDGTPGRERPGPVTPLVDQLKA